MNIEHLGRGVWAISRFGVDSGGGYLTKPWTPVREQAFLEELKQNNRRILIAFTADKYQQGIRGALAKAGFKEIVTFKSSHSAADENLTMWLKRDKNAPAVEPEERKEWFYIENCSIDMARDDFSTTSYRHRCTVCVPRARLNFSFIIKAFKCFEQVEKLPLYFRVAKSYIVKDYRNNGAKNVRK